MNFLTEGGLLPPCLRTAKAAQTAGFDCLEKSILYYTNVLLVLVALGAFLMILYGAFLYASAFGDEAKVTQAKKVVTNALVGVALAVVAGVIIALIKSILKA